MIGSSTHFEEMLRAPVAPCLRASSSSIRMFVSSVFRDAESAPDELLDLLETGKYGTYADEGTAGSGWRALRALHLKYDTWRDWIAWETPERY